MIAGAAGHAAAEDPAHPGPLLRRLGEYEPPVETPDATAHCAPGKPPGKPPGKAPGIVPVPQPEPASDADTGANDAAHRVLRAVVEVLAGQRAAQQLRPLLADEPFALLTRLAVRRRPVALRAVRSCQPAAGVVEATVVYRIGERYRAIAARLERTDDEPRPWRCTVLRMC